MGYTEHGLRHTNLVSNIAQNILIRLGFTERQGELAAIAGAIFMISQYRQSQGPFQKENYHFGTED
jgi:hypothetical protein